MLRGPERFFYDKCPSLRLGGVESGARTPAHTPMADLNVWPKAWIKAWRSSCAQGRVPRWTVRGGGEFDEA